MEIKEDDFVDLFELQKRVNDLEDEVELLKRGLALNDRIEAFKKKTYSDYSCRYYKCNKDICQHVRYFGHMPHWYDNEVDTWRPYDKVTTTTTTTT